MAKDKSGGTSPPENESRGKKLRDTESVQLSRSMVKQLKFIANQRGERLRQTVTPRDIADELFTAALAAAYKKALSEEQV